ncbi:MAG TPA: UPF0175 family protein [Bacillota bacterium]|nr:UPF0175 family protein [Bacillota bacterium]
MAIISLRVPESREKAVGRVAGREGFDRSTAFRRLILVGLERYVADLFRDGEISLRQAAEWLDVPLREAMDRLERAGVAGNVGVDEVRAALADLGELEGP